jgi:CRISPR-associated endonuclease Cas1
MGKGRGVGARLVGICQRGEQDADTRTATERTPCNAALNYGYAVTLGNCTRALVGLGLDPSFGFLHHADAPGRLSLSYDLIELLRPRVDACVFRFLKSGPFDRKEFVESGSQVLLGPRIAREVALRVLAEVPTDKCDEAARRIAKCILARRNCRPSGRIVVTQQNARLAGFRGTRTAQTTR